MLPQISRNPRTAVPSHYQEVGVKLLRSLGNHFCGIACVDEHRRSCPECSSCLKHNDPHPRPIGRRQREFVREAPSEVLRRHLTGCMNNCQLGLIFPGKPGGPVHNVLAAVSQIHSAQNPAAMNLFERGRCFRMDACPDRAIEIVEYLGSDGANQEPAKSAQPVSRNHHQIRTPAPRMRHDLRLWFPRHANSLGSEEFEIFRQELIQLFLPAQSQVFGQVVLSHSCNMEEENLRLEAPRNRRYITRGSETTSPKNRRETEFS